jgi:hypothetical protein
LILPGKDLIGPDREGDPNFFDMDKERRGLPSASSMERYHACGASLPLERLLRERGELPPDEDNEAASHGRLIHAIAASLLLPDREDLAVAGAGKPAWEEAQQYVDAAKEIAVRAWGDDEEAQAIVEERMFLTNESGNQIATGQADVIWLRGTEAIVIDYKTGWNPLKHARDSWQLKLYAAMTYQRFGCISIRVAYIHRGEFHSEEIIDKSDLEVMSSLVFPGMVGDIDQNPFRQQFSPGEDVCRYCACKLKCPALNAQYMIMEPKAEMDSTFLPALTNYQLEKMKSAMEALKGFEKSLEAEMTSRAQDDEFAFNGYEVAPGRGRRTVEDAGAMCEALVNEGASVADIYEAVKLGVGDAEKIHRKMTKLKGVMAKEDFLTKFGDFITQHEGKPALRKRKDA